MRKLTVILSSLALGVSGCGTAGLEKENEETISSKSEDLVDSSGQRWLFVGTVGSDEALKKDTRWQNVNFEALSTQEKAFYLRPELMLRGKIYRLSDEDVSRTAEAIVDTFKPREPGLPEGLAADTSIRYPKHIFGSDDRADSSSWTHLYPYSTIGTLNPAGWTCSVFKVYNHHTAMTAGHCWGDNWNKGPAVLQFGNRPTNKPFPAFGTTGSWTNNPPCYGVTRPANYSESNLRTDFAVIKLRDTNLGIDCGFSNYNVGYLGNSYGYSDPQYIFGYPAVPRSPAPYPSLMHLGGDVHSGDSGYRQDTDIIDTSGGQSGGPWIWVGGDGGWYVTAVHVREYYVPFDWENQGASVASSMWNLVPGWAGN